MSHDRAALQRLARDRLAEARVLLANGYPSGAYYLAGYALECALRAVIAQQFRADEIPDLKRVSKIYTHDLSQLMDIAGLRSALEAEIAAALISRSAGRLQPNGPSGRVMSFGPMTGLRLYWMRSGAKKGCSNGW